MSDRPLALLLERWGDDSAAIQSRLIPQLSAGQIIEIMTLISGGGGSLLRPSQAPANLLGPAAEPRTSRCLDGIRATFPTATKILLP